MKSIAFALVGAVSITAVAGAQSLDNVRVRGTVSMLDGKTLTVSTREKKQEVISLIDGWQVSGVAKADVDDIKVGDFVGIASENCGDTAWTVRRVLRPYPQNRVLELEA